jgi:predicted transcriptional regulator of viral defense system
MDTANGIADWWVPAGGIRVDPTAMRRVLDQLVERGLLERIGQGNYAHYRLRSDELQNDEKHDGT